MCKLLSYFLALLMFIVAILLWTVAYPVLKPLDFGQWFGIIWFSLMGVIGGVTTIYIEQGNKKLTVRKR